MIASEHQQERAAPGELFRLEREPRGAPAGGILLVHGLGDHIGRYAPLADRLATLGYAVTGVDFPGHGRSPGKRGDVGNWARVDRLLSDSVTWLRDRTGGEGGGHEPPLGLFAHSMGAMAGMRYLLDHPGTFQFAWLGSMLTKPGARSNRVLRALAPLGARLLPKVTLDTGVTTDLCRAPGSAAAAGREAGPPPREDPLLHRRVSFRFAAALLDLEREIEEDAPSFPGKLRLLMTHGGADRVCLASDARALFDRLPLENKEFVLFDGELHEPLFGPRGIELLATLEEWLARGKAG